jgi:hypothetical protein
VNDSNDSTQVPAHELDSAGGETNENDSIKGEQFVSEISSRTAGDWRGRRISGKVNLRGVRFENSLTICGAVFTDEVDFSQARFERGVDLTGCHFEQKLILADARVEGPLALNEVQIGPNPELRSNSPFKLQERAEFNNLRVSGCLSM